MIRKQILLLYRSKLRVCRKMGYTYGNWNHTKTLNDDKLAKGQFLKLVKKNKLGDFLWNTVRRRYKINRFILDYDMIMECIDEGFSSLKHINFLYQTLLELNNKPKLLPSTKKKDYFNI